MTKKYSVEKSPSPVYGARLELVYALIAHRGFESLLLRQIKRLNCEVYAVFLFVLPALCKKINSRCSIVDPMNSGRFLYILFTVKQLNKLNSRTYAELCIAVVEYLFDCALRYF